MKLLPVTEARARMLAQARALPAESVPLHAAVGRVLAEGITAVRDQPPFPASAMDGYAVRAADTPGSLALIGESAAGAGFRGEVGPRQAVRIFTGAAIPPGCNAVVIQEEAKPLGHSSVVVPQTPVGQHVRPSGGDFQAGRLLLPKGFAIDPWRLSLAAAAGRAEIAVVRRPVVAVFSTGEEIVDAPAEPGPFQIYNSGAPALSALIAAWGGEPVRAHPVRDDLDATVEALRGAKADLIVTIGGASVGDHDLVRKAAGKLGLDLKVASVNVRPGKPTFFGPLADGRLLLGLPGNPASAFVCAELFLRPLLRALQGADPTIPTITARLAEQQRPNGPREHWMRARLSYEGGEVRVAPYRDQDSSLVTVFAAADALMCRPADAPGAQMGDAVEVIPLSRA